MPEGNRAPEATIGCGSLILIALIVLIFGKSNTNELERDVQNLRSDVRDLRDAVETQSREIKGLRADFVKARAN